MREFVPQCHNSPQTAINRHKMCGTYVPQQYHSATTYTEYIKMGGDAL